MRTSRVFASLLLVCIAAQSLALPWQLWTGQDVVQVDSVAEGTGTTTFSWTHTPVGTLAGVLVACFTNVTSTDVISGATYDGEAMTLVARAVDTASEIGSVEVYYLGTGVNTGAVSAQCTVSSGTDAKHGVSVGVRAPKDTEVSSCTSAEITDPSCTATVTSGASLSIASLWSGENAPSGNAMAANQAWLLAHNHDFGTTTTMVAYQQHTRAGGDSLIATNMTSDADSALVGAAIRVVP